MRRYVATEYCAICFQWSTSINDFVIVLTRYRYPLLIASSNSRSNALLLFPPIDFCIRISIDIVRLYILIDHPFFFFTGSISAKFDFCQLIQSRRTSNHWFIIIYLFIYLLLFIVIINLLFMNKNKTKQNRYWLCGICRSRADVGAFASEEKPKSINSKIEKSKFV